MSLDKKSGFIFTDEELISRFQNGDERAYVELVNRYKDRLLNFVFHFLGDLEQHPLLAQYRQEIEKQNSTIYLCIG